MPYDLSIRKTRDVLQVHVTGKRTLETVSAMAREILEACLREGKPKVLVDVRELAGRLPEEDAYTMAAWRFPELGRRRVLSAAAIVDMAEYEDQFRYFENVARNRGFNLHIFGDVDSAMKWLGEDS